MITPEKIASCEKENITDLLPALESDDIPLLVAWLAEKEDNFRYKVFLLLQARSQSVADVYSFWDVLAEKLEHTNSFHRNIGLVLIAENVRWDRQGRFNALLDTYLAHCEDEKPITARQCIRSLSKIVPYNTDCHAKVIDKLTTIDLMACRETMRKLFLLDILEVFYEIQKIQPDQRIERYYYQAMTGGLLDEKTKRQIAWR